MLHLVPQVYWLSLPVAAAGIVHMIVVKVDLWPRLGVPVDGGLRVRGRRLLGANKTWRGVVIMTLVPAVLGAVQGALGGAPAASVGLEVVDFAQAAASLGLPSGHVWGYACVNAVLGLGYVLGELPNSFVKRQLDLEPGEAASGRLRGVFLVVDRADSVVTALILGGLVFGWGLSTVLVGTVCLCGLHLAITTLLVRTGVKRAI